MTKLLKYKRLSQKAAAPKKALAGDACYDLVAVSVEYCTKDLYVEYGTGLAFEIPEGYVGLIFPRSSITNKNMMLKNSVGVIDSGYRGEVKFRFQMTPSSGSYMPIHYDVGERVGQIMLVPVEEFELQEVQELGSSARANSGYGSTGK